MLAASLVREEPYLKEAGSDFSSAFRAGVLPEVVADRVTESIDVRFGLASLSSSELREASIHLTLQEAPSTEFSPGSSHHITQQQVQPPYLD